MIIITHHTKNKGDLAVFEIMRDLAHQGFMLLNPHTEHAPFDIVAYKDKKFYRIQVKHRKLYNGSVRVKLSTNWSDKNGNHVNQMDKSEVDILAIYCPDNGYCFYVNPNDFEKNISLRVLKSKNNQFKGCNLAHNYSELK